MGYDGVGWQSVSENLLGWVGLWFWKYPMAWDGMNFCLNGSEILTKVSTLYIKTHRRD